MVLPGLKVTGMMEEGGDYLDVVLEKAVSKVSVT